ncbi:MAG: DUF5615 family PIN-like protein [Thioploca sp.]|nr:DUF5615 family PIN-like protein [Thioploca sp.]
MKIILDENIPRYLKLVLDQYEVSTVQEQGWSGMSNGDLLSIMEELFDLFITADKNLKYQQNLINRRIAIIQLYTNRLPLLKKIESKIIQEIEHIKLGQYIEILP